MKQKMKKVFESAIWWSGVVMVGLVLGISLQFVKAWTEPVVAPPGGNVGAPINTGDIGQTKWGVLQVLGFIFHNNPDLDGDGIIDNDVTGKILTAQDAYGSTAWAAGAGGGGSYEAYGTTSCAPGWTVAYTGKAFTTYAMVTGSTFNIAGGGIKCTALLTNIHSDSYLGMKWFSSWSEASQDSVPCAVCVK